ncbi:hypothetical protein EVAR_95584_1 [Eumeta japonica]|uniref:Uncharacterized protein n=1 Tax=Eumeta variegata TaxID=151549 RepID=A0A4C1VMH3_EUMVA|nr:hypothetical protein EVAR_95584_1 [Eumeta japonica]
MQLTGMLLPTTENNFKQYERNSALHRRNSSRPLRKTHSDQIFVMRQKKYNLENVTRVLRFLNVITHEYVSAVFQQTSLTIKNHVTDSEPTRDRRTSRRRRRVGREIRKINTRADEQKARRYIHEVANAISRDVGPVQTRADPPRDKRRRLVIGTVCAYCFIR